MSCDFILFIYLFYYSVFFTIKRDQIFAIGKKSQVFWLKTKCSEEDPCKTHYECVCVYIYECRAHMCTCVPVDSVKYRTAKYWIIHAEHRHQLSSVLNWKYSLTWPWRKKKEEKSFRAHSFYGHMTVLCVHFLNNQMSRSDIERFRARKTDTGTRIKILGKWRLLADKRNCFDNIQRGKACRSTLTHTLTPTGNMHLYTSSAMHKKKKKKKFLWTIFNHTHPCTFLHKFVWTASPV